MAELYVVELFAKEIGWWAFCSATHELDSSNSLVIHGGNVRSARTCKAWILKKDREFFFTRSYQSSGPRMQMMDYRTCCALLAWKRVVHNHDRREGRARDALRCPFPRYFSCDDDEIMIFDACNVLHVELIPGTWCVTRLSPGSPASTDRKQCRITTKQNLGIFERRFDHYYVIVEG